MHYINIMIKLFAEAPRDQKIIGNLQRSIVQFKKRMKARMENRVKKFKDENKTLKKDNKKLEDENKKLEEQLDEYRKRHPSTVGVKNGKPYVIMNQEVSKSKSERKPGAQKYHRGHFRPIPHITERIKVRASVLHALNALEFLYAKA